MEEEGWKKDENPYLVIPCRKCKQYMYVKTTQKTKKCLRCGRQHTVSSIINSGEIVKGMTNAAEMVKTRQNELAVIELGNTPEFRAVDDFTVRSRIRQSYEEIPKTKTTVDDNYYISKFREMLVEISRWYRKFPFYILEIIAENYNIPNSEVKLLAKAFQKNGILVQTNDAIYRVNL